MPRVPPSSGLGFHQDGPGQSSWELPCRPNVNHEVDQDVPVGSIYSLLPRSRCQPPLELYVTHPRRTGEFACSLQQRWGRRCVNS